MGSLKTLSTARLIVLIVIADGIVGIDFGAIGVALPSIGVALHASSSQLQWIISAYALGLAGLVIVGGYLTDQFGEGRSFIGGCFLYAIGVLLALASPSITYLIAARCLQGMATAILIPTVLSLITSRFTDGPSRLRILAIHVSAGFIINPLATLVAGFLITQMDWRACFMVMLPFPLLGLVLGYLLLGVAKRDEQESKPINIMAAAGATVGLTLLVWSLSEIFAPRGGATLANVLGLVGGVAILSGFVLQQRTAKNPLIPAAMLRYPNFAAAILVYALLNLSISGGFALVHMSLQRSAGYTPFESALMYIPKGVLAIFVSSMIVPRTTGLLLSNPRRSLVIAIGVVCMGQLWMSFANPALPMVVNFLLPMFVITVGNLLASSIVMGEAFRHVPAGERGVTAALINASRFILVAVGMSVIISVADTGHGASQLPLSVFATSYRMSAGFGLLGIMAVIFLMRPSRLPTSAALG